MKSIFKQFQRNFAAVAILASLIIFHAQAAVPPVLVTLTVNGTGDTTLVKGWPVLAQVQLSNPAFGSASTPITLSGGNRPWSSLIRFHITDSANRSIRFPFRALTKTDASIELGSDNVGMVAYALTPQESAYLIAGSYQVSVEVAGFGTSPVSAVVVTSAPANLSPQQIHWQYMLLASYEGLLKHFDAAIATLNTLISEQPQDVVALEFRGDLLSAAGRAQEAASAYANAVEVWEQLNPNPQEPPVSLLRKISSSAY